MRRPPDRRRQRGIALVVVLWLGVLLAVVANSLAGSVRSDTLAARNRLQALQARHLAEAGLVRSLLELGMPAGDDWRRGEGARRRFELAGGSVEATLRPASGLLNINQAAPATLAKLLQVLGAAPERSQRLADAVMDWRDQDDLRRLNGAEAGDYRAAGLGYAPRNAPFPHLQEVRQVLGMDAGLFERLRPHLTLWSQGGAPDARHATRELLLVVYSSDEQTVDEYLESREAVPGNLSEGPWHLSIEARVENGGRSLLNVVVSRQAAGGWRIENWHNAWRRTDDG